MKLSLSRKTLVTALGIAKSAISTKTNLPILKHALITTDDSMASITCTDLDTSIRVTLPADDAADGRITTSTDLLHNIVKSFPEGKEDTVVELHADDKGVNIHSGQSRYRLGTLDPAEFPAWPEMDETEAQITMPQATLLELLTTVAHANEGVEANRYTFGGVLFKLDKNAFTVVACDGRRLAIMGCDFTTDHTAESIVPNRTIHILLSLLSPAGDKNITMIFNDNRIYFKLDHIDIASKLIEGRYPNYQQVIPEIESRQCVILRQELLANLKRLTYINGSVAFRFTRQQLTLKARSANQDYPGDATEVIDLPAPYSGNFTANAKYFVSLLEAVTDEEIRFQVTAKDQPVVLQGTEKNWISVIMPMQEPKAAPATKAAAPEADAVAATN